MSAHHRCMIQSPSHSPVIHSWIAVYRIGSLRITGCGLWHLGMCNAHCSCQTWWMPLLISLFSFLSHHCSSPSPFFSVYINNVQWEYWLSVGCSVACNEHVNVTDNVDCRVFSNNVSWIWIGCMFDMYYILWIYVCTNQKIQYSWRYYKMVFTTLIRHICTMDDVTRYSSCRICDVRVHWLSGILSTCYVGWCILGCWWDKWCAPFLLQHR